MSEFNVVVYSSRSVTRRAANRTAPKAAPKTTARKPATRRSAPRPRSLGAHPPPRHVDRSRRIRAAGGCAREIEARFLI